MPTPHPDPTRRSRVSIDALLLLLGAARTHLLVDIAAGQRLPSRDRFRRHVRRTLLVHDWLSRGYSSADLASKYGLSASHVRRLTTQARLRATRAHPPLT